MTIELREATADDLPDVLALYAQPAMDNGMVLPTTEAEAVLAEFARYPSYRLFVACEGAAVVGSYALLVMHNLAHRGTPSAIVEDVVVAPGHQGRGLGRRMMVHALGLARDAGCYKLALSSNRKRQAAHGFYESLGFSQHGLSFTMEL
ncbi:MAG: GNAT family N-acetyltransferase [Pseudomonadota bacterium]